MFDEIKRIVAGESGLDIGHYKDKCIKRRIAVRIRAKGCPSAVDYLVRLRSDEGEIKNLLRVLTINVTQFFRNMPTYEGIRDLVLPVLFRDKAMKGEKELGIWSAGCSSGEEPYSIAILLKEYFERDLRRFTVSITATDIDAEMIDRAREGVYEEGNMAEMPPPLKKKYFTREEKGRYRLAEGIKAMVTFRAGNILADGVCKGQDLILCRNTLIYFTREQQRLLLDNLMHALRPGGYLVLGQAETLLADSRKHFDVVCTKERIYRKKD